MRGQGYLRGAADPGFFQGLAGIGYEMLRAASPGIVPSVLAFERPSRAVVELARRSGEDGWTAMALQRPAYQIDGLQPADVPRCARR